MKPSTFFSDHRIVTALIALFFVLIVGAAAFFLTRQQPVPVTGVVSPAQAEADAHPSIDLGSGSVLEMDSQQGKNVAPDTSFKALPAPMTQPQQSLSASYVEDLLHQQGYVMEPASSVDAQSAPVTQPQQCLSASYVEDLLRQQGYEFPTTRPVAP